MYKKFSCFLKFVLLSSPLLLPQSLWAQTMEELASVTSEASNEQRKNQELEQKAMEQKDRVERTRREYEIKILLHKNNIEDLKSSQEKYQRQIENLQIEFVTLDNRAQEHANEWTLFESEYAKRLAMYDSLKKEYTEKQQKLADDIATFERQKQNAENSNYVKGIELQRLKSEYAAAETRAQQADAERTNAEADELVTKAALLQVKVSISDKIRQRNEALALAQVTKKNLEKATNALKQSRSELAKYEKLESETAKTVKNDVARFEKEIIAATSKRLESDSDRFRLQADIEKLKDYSSRIKSNFEKAVSEQSDASSMVLKTRLAVHTARSELSSQAQVVDQQTAKQSKLEAKNRSIAATAQVSEMFGGTKQWIGSTTCKMHSEPQASSNTVGSIASGSRVLARDAARGWVEVINGSGSPVYVEDRCGSYSGEESN